MIKKYNYVPFLDDEEEVYDYNNYYYWNGVFSETDCDTIIQMGKKRKLDSGVVESEHLNNVDDSIKSRRSKIAWMDLNPETEWIYERIHKYAVLTNKEMKWNFNLYGFIDLLQFTEYSDTYKGHYDFHSDLVRNTTVRKMSVVLQLSDENSYTGGDFEIFNRGTMPRKRASLLFFPSFLVHKVHPVTSGTRYSLVTWISGPRFF